jgi:hypothetical protein
VTVEIHGLILLGLHLGNDATAAELDPDHQQGLPLSSQVVATSDVA